jgi:hypothetical protein
MNFNAPNAKLLIEKWGKESLGKLSVAGISDYGMKEQLAILLENQDNFARQGSVYNMLNETSQGSSTVASTTVNDTAAGAFAPIALALVRRTFPELFANKCVAVQAMSGPVGLAYALRWLYNTSTSPKDEAGFAKVDIYSGFTGSQSGTSGTADSGVGVATATAEGWQIGGSASTGKYPELTLRIDQTSVTAKTRKIASSLSLDTLMDIKNMHGIDVMRNITEVLHYELLAELDRELLAAMKAAAIDTANGGAAATTLNVSATTGLGSDGRWSQEKFQNIVTQIVKLSTDIATATRRGAGNFVIVSNRIATALQAAGPIFSRNTATVNPNNTYAEVGTINNMITVYRDSYATSDYALVGYKGPGIQDSGLIYSPYVTGLESRAIDPSDFSPRIGICNRYGITSSLLGSGRYYRQLNVTNLDYLIG